MSLYSPSCGNIYQFSVEVPLKVYHQFFFRIFHVVSLSGQLITLKPCLLQKLQKKKNGTHEYPDFVFFRFHDCQPFRCKTMSKTLFEQDSRRKEAAVICNLRLWRVSLSSPGIYYIVWCRKRALNSIYNKNFHIKF